MPEDDLVADHFLAGRLALGAGIAGHDHVGLVVEDAPLGELLVAAHVRLAVIGDQLDHLGLAVDLDAAGIVDLLDGELVAVGLRRRHDREIAGEIIDRADDDLILGQSRTDCAADTDGPSGERQRCDGSKSFLHHAFFPCLPGKDGTTTRTTVRAYHPRLGSSW